MKSKTNAPPASPRTEEGNRERKKNCKLRARETHKDGNGHIDRGRAVKTRSLKKKKRTEPGGKKSCNRGKKSKSDVLQK